MNQARSIGREIGTALAVLAIYLLTVLTPLHHARASQLAFEELGYAMAQSSWVLCTPDGADGEDGDVIVAKCHATGPGKVELMLPVLGAMAIRHDVALAAPLMASPPAFPPRAIAPSGGPRAPPVLV
ncbi:MAG TPA: hypothetical protein VL017_04680 [Devosia sp.]|nr:hypothetical protein [Devosia sp.]